MLDYEGRKTIERNQFRLLHYAGEVTYTTVGFIDKNNDMLYRSLKEAANMSADPIVREMYPESELLSQKRPPTVSVCVCVGGYMCMYRIVQCIEKHVQYFVSAWYLW